MENKSTNVENGTTAQTDANTVLADSFFRPSTRGELLEALKKGIKCEVVGSNMEITNICLDGWLKFEGKYRTLYSPNKGWIIYEAV
jgi:hypothetical protein